MKKFLIVLSVISVISISTVGWASGDFQKSIRGIAGSKIDSKKNTSHKSALSEQQIIDGLKEALHVSTQNATITTGKVNGYFGNPTIKILMPEKLQKIEKGLRQVGDGKMVDDFILSMNQAAERAAPSAKEIIWNAIKGMSFDDARKILTGDNTAATEYFRVKTSNQLTEAFLPIIVQATNDVGVTRKYKKLEAKAKSMPYLRIKPVDIDQYVVTKALAGLFYTIGEEEKKIRKDPMARVTDLLKQVFGAHID
jgi:hypothetical protein